MTNSNSADISVFEGLQASASASMGAGSTSQMSVFNASFTERKTLTPEEKTKAEKSKKKILDAEKAFRAEDNKYQSEIAEAKQKVNGVIQKRITAANTFEQKKPNLELELKPFDITVKWNEPTVDATHVDLVV